MPKKRRFTKIFLCELIILLFFLLTYFNNPDKCYADIHYLTILHTNDVHGRLVPIDYSNDQLSVGGIARRAALIKSIKATHKNVLTLDAGDTFQGTIFFKLFNGIPDAKFMSEIGYDASTIGNHEFDKGIDTLEKIICSASYPYISSNIKFLHDEKLNKKVAGYIIKNYDGFKVGIIGVTTDKLKTLINNYDNNIRVSSDIKTVKKLVKKLKPEVDFIVVLSHIGFEEDVKLAKMVPDIDVIVGGHSHSFLTQPSVIREYNKPAKTLSGIGAIIGESLNYLLTYSYILPDRMNKTLIVQDGEFGINLGELDLVIKDDKIENYNYRLIPVNNCIPEDKSIAAEVNLLSQKADNITKNTVGFLNTPLDSRKNSLRSGLTTAGLLITEAIKSKYPDIDIVMQNSGGIRGNKYINAGPITLADIFELYPFENTIVLLKLSGSDIKSILETGTASLFNDNSSSLQTNGLDYTVDLSQKEGSRVSEIKVNGIPLNPKCYYKVAVNDFMFGGGDGFFQFKKAKKVIKTNILLQNLIINYVKNNSPVSLTVKDKIEIKNLR